MGKAKQAKTKPLSMSYSNSCQQVECPPDMWESLLKIYGENKAHRILRSMWAVAFGDELKVGTALEPQKQLNYLFSTAEIYECAPDLWEVFVSRIGQEKADKFLRALWAMRLSNWIQSICSPTNKDTPQQQLECLFALASGKGTAPAIHVSVRHYFHRLVHLMCDVRDTDGNPVPVAVRESELIDYVEELGTVVTEAQAELARFSSLDDMENAA